MDRVLGLALAAIASQGIALSQSTIYGIAPASGSPFTLYRISAATGAGSMVGPIFGAVSVNAIAFAPNGRLYGSGSDFLFKLFSPLLLTIDASSGASTQVAIRQRLHFLATQDQRQFSFPPRKWNAVDGDFPAEHVGIEKPQCTDSLDQGGVRHSFLLDEEQLMAANVLSAKLIG
jgi:hypothetical protein